MGVNTKAINPRKQVRKLVEVGSTINKVATMKASGNKIICMAMANFSMRIPNQLMKDNGSMIDFMGKEKFIMTNLSFLTHRLTIKTLII